MSSLVVDDLCFEVRRSPRRKSMQITVDRGGELVLSAPEECPVAKLEGFVREKRFWIYTKLAEKEALGTHAPTKEYVNGEGFPYLGRSYRLLLVNAQDAPVKLQHGRFKMRRVDAPDGRRHMVAWYSAHARPWVSRRIERFRGRVGVDPAGVVVQDLGYRWGSCGKGGKLYFHWRSILLPARIVDYIIVHELVHLHEPHHTPEFWTRLERAMPDFALRKRWLAEHARGLSGP
jgi:predicted metal-dependent hydrolase